MHSKNLTGLEVFNAHMAWKWPRKSSRHFPGIAAGGGPHNANLSKTFLLWYESYDITSAAPSLVIVQRRAPCLCNADPCACAKPPLMPVQWQARRYELHTLGPPRPFFPLAVPTQPCAKQCKVWIWEFARVERGIFVDCHQHAKHLPSQWRSDFPNTAAKQRIPSA